MPIYAIKLKSIDIENYANGLRDGQWKGKRESDKGGERDGRSQRDAVDGDARPKQLKIDKDQQQWVKQRPARQLDQLRQQWTT